jgi:hypothetical protein
MVESSVTDEELASCAAVLRRLRASELESPRLRDVCGAGQELFRSRIIKQRFKGEDVVEFLTKQGNYRGMLKRLEKLHTEIERNHSTRVEAATSCGMNSSRLQRTKEVASHGLVALSAGAEAERVSHGQMLLDASGNAKLALGPGIQGDSEPASVPGGGSEFRGSQLAPAVPSAAADGVKRDASGQVLGWAHSGSGSVDDVEEDVAEADIEAKLGGLSNANDVRAAFPKGSFRKVCNICKSQ